METLRPFGVLQVYKSIKGISGWGLLRRADAHRAAK